MFSVLMSVYAKEQPEYLRQSLESVFNQTVTPDEVIMVEDGPLTDKLYEELDRFSVKHSQLKRVRLSKNGGLGNALNEGLKYCSYELVARMDTDDICYPFRFEKQIDVFSQYPDADVVSSWIDEFIDSPENIVSTRKLPEFPYELYEFGKSRSPANHAVVMFRKKAILFAGGYRHFPLLEDYYLWVRLMLNGVKFYTIQDSLLLVRTSNEMFHRRGGLRYALNEIRFQNLIRKLGYISYGRFVLNIIIRFVTRIVPNKLRTYIYNKYLRTTIR